jgi:hypothetical protein
MLKLQPVEVLALSADGFFFIFVTKSATGPSFPARTSALLG